MTKNELKVLPNQIIRRFKISAHFWSIRYDCKKLFHIKWIRPYTGEDFTVNKIYL